MHSSEAKKVVKTLQKHVRELQDSFEKLTNPLKEDNSVLEALTEYRKLYESTTVEECKGVGIDEDAEAFINSFIDECDNSQPSEGLTEFSDKIEAILKQGKALDTNLDDSSLKEEAKEAAKKELLSLISPEKEQEIENISLKVLSDGKKHIESCFAEEVNDFLETIQQNTEEIENCVSKQS